MDSDLDIDISDTEPVNASLFNKRKNVVDDAEPVKKAKREDDTVYSLLFEHLEDLRQLLSVLVSVQSKVAVDGVLFNVVNQDDFSGVCTTLMIGSLMIIGRVKCRLRKFPTDPRERTCFFVNVEALLTQLRHVKTDHLCVITKYRNQEQLVINAYATARGTTNTQRMTLREVMTDSYEPDWFPEMTYGFDMVLSAMDMKNMVQQVVDIGAQLLSVTLFRNSDAQEGDIASLFQFEADAGTRCQSLQQRHANLVGDAVDTDGVFSLDAAIDDAIENKHLVQVARCGYSVDTLKDITSALKNQHQIVLSFGLPAVKNEESGEFDEWDQFAKDSEQQVVDFLNGALYLSVNMSTEGSYIKILLGKKIDDDL